MITNEEYTKIFSLEDLTESEIIQHRQDYFGDTDPLVGSSYVFDWSLDEESESEFLVVTSKHYFETNGYLVDQDDMCPVLPTDQDESKIFFYEEMPSYYMVDGAKDFSKAEVQKFLLSLGMTRTDLLMEGAYPLSTEAIKNKIDVWMTNLSDNLDLQKLQWKRLSKKKRSNITVPVVNNPNILVSKQHSASTVLQDTVVREFVNVGKTQTHKLTVITTNEDKNVGYWWVEKL